LTVPRPPAAQPEATGAHGAGAGDGEGVGFRDAAVYVVEQWASMDEGAVSRGPGERACFAKRLEGAVAVTRAPAAGLCTSLDEPGRRAFSHERALGAAGVATHVAAQVLAARARARRRRRRLAAGDAACRELGR